LIVVAVIGLLSAIAVPQVLRARMAANEGAAIGSLRAIASGQAAYASSCGGGGYATDLADLVRPPSSSRAYISPDLDHNGVAKSGYVYSVAKNGGADATDVTAPTCNAAANVRASAFFARAVPVTPGQTGGRYFATDTPGAMYYGAAPIPNPIPAGTSTVQ
jgi:type II secretory pathway pseudopilin PulG